MHIFICIYHKCNLMQLKGSSFNQSVTEILLSWDFTCRTFLLVAAGSQQCSGDYSHLFWFLDVPRLLLIPRFPSVPSCAPAAGAHPSPGLLSLGSDPFPPSLGSVSSPRSSSQWDSQSCHLNTCPWLWQDVSKANPTESVRPCRLRSHL